jgi:hypothetical protein
MARASLDAIVYTLYYEMSGILFELLTQNEASDGHTAKCNNSYEKNQTGSKRGEQREDRSCDDTGRRGEFNRCSINQ